MTHPTFYKALFFFGLAAGVSGCWSYPGDGYDGEPGAVEPERPVVAAPEAELTIADTSVDPWLGARLPVELLVTSEAESVEAVVYLDGVEIESRTLTPEPADPTMPDAPAIMVTVFDLDTLLLATAPHEVIVWVTDPDGQQASAGQWVTLGEGLIATAADVPATDDGWFGGGIEPELHLFDADTDTWLGCTYGTPYEGRPVIFFDGEGALVRDDIATRNVEVLIIENDGAPCPAPTSIGDVSTGDDDDLLARGEPVSGLDVDHGVSSGTVALAWGRGY